MSKRFVHRGADPEADAIAAADAPVPDATRRAGKRSADPVIAPELASRPDTSGLPDSRARTLIDAARLYSVRPDGHGYWENGRWVPSLRGRDRTLHEASKLYAVSPDHDGCAS
jgi:hypothetical protein